jgi:hypothetical protein
MDLQFVVHGVSIVGKTAELAVGLEISFSVFDGASVVGKAVELSAGL